MKKNSFIPFITLFILLSCVNSQKMIKNDFFNSVTGTYVTENWEGERGYNITLRFESAPTPPPSFVVFNKIKQKIYLENQSKKEVITVYIPVNSEKLADHKPIVVDSENGIIFEQNGKEYFFPVKFVKSKK